MKKVEYLDKLNPFYSLEELRDFLKDAGILFDRKTLQDFSIEQADLFFGLIEERFPEPQARQQFLKSLITEFPKQEPMTQQGQDFWEKFKLAVSVYIRGSKRR